MAVSALFLKRIYEKHDQEYDGKPEITDGDSLSIRISKHRKIIFQLRYRYKGKPIRLKIGEYPSMSLSEARNVRDDYIFCLSKGKDPRHEILLQRNESVDFTITDCVDYWYKHHVAPNRANPETIYNKVRKHIPKKWQNMPIIDLRIRDFTRFFDDVTQFCRDTGKDGNIKVTLTEIKGALRFCSKRGIIENTAFELLNPSDFAPPVNVRDRVLSDREIGLIWFQCDSFLLKRNQTILKLLLIYGCRIGELCNSKKKHFDLKARLWTVPKEISKSSKAIRRPIPDFLVPLIEQALHLYPESEWMFLNKSKTRPVLTSSLSSIARLCDEHLGISEFVLHDIRRTLSTKMTDLGCPIHITEKLLGHAMGGVLAVYNKSDMLDEIEHWMIVWKDHIASCVEIAKQEENELF
ncbi:tyrosine-type recombinase/integrase [Algicola sagamiensis]|uniref:tyrosine-type recombinase/integrase n=1 Tax=Algicola sagamiensis TaxID=163869 RepID=UPI0003724622|nr:site-specific integrase [Algicola sagamiensis]